ncbi:MAG TPA: hypothetical protein VGP26_05805 [Actinophytocola sp.]|jgi:hypothetical protein|nr:hypothetical protein [Actinophytocola sp.]
MRAEIDRVIALRESIGLDVLVHGEPERNDMVQYFAERAPRDGGEGVRSRAVLGGRVWLCEVQWLAAAPLDDADRASS